MTFPDILSQSLFLLKTNRQKTLFFLFLVTMNFIRVLITFRVRDYKNLSKYKTK